MSFWDETLFSFSNELKTEMDFFKNGILPINVENFEYYEEIIKNLKQENKLFFQVILAHLYLILGQFQKSRNLINQLLEEELEDKINELSYILILKAILEKNKNYLYVVREMLYKDEKGLEIVNEIFKAMNAEIEDIYFLAFSRSSFFNTLFYVGVIFNDIVWFNFGENSGLYQSNNVMDYRRDLRRLAVAYSINPYEIRNIIENKTSAFSKFMEYLGFKSFRNLKIAISYFKKAYKKAYKKISYSQDYNFITNFDIICRYDYKSILKNFDMDLRKDVLRIAKKVYNASLKEILSERNFSINCPFCISKNIVVNGYSKNKKRFLCKDCKKSFFLNLSLSHKIL
jgi:hypothetical protein